MPKKAMMRNGDFMTEPSGGWLHDSQALAHGAGVYYSFPVKYLGSIQVLKSLRTLSMDDKTSLCREGIARCVNASKVMKTVKTKPPKAIKEYLADQPYIKVMDLKLNVSTDGIATSNLESSQIISNDPIGKISFSAGGTDKHYTFVTYVAKDRRENRYCHVFDCGKLADDILATLGQVFTLIKEPVARPRPSAPALPPNHPTLKPGDAGALMGVAALQAAPKVAPPTESYEEMSAAPGVPPPVPMAREILNYDDGDENYAGVDVPVAAASTEFYDAMDDPPPRPAGPKPGALDLYEAMGAGEDFVSFLNKNENLKSNHIYGDADSDTSSANLYGDGQTGWSYLDVKPEPDLYGTLADIALQAAQ